MMEVTASGNKWLSCRMERFLRRQKNKTEQRQARKDKKTKAKRKKAHSKPAPRNMKIPTAS
jgi:uncharacterized protein YdaU (DUF1376 family)